MFILFTHHVLLQPHPLWMLHCVAPRMNVHFAVDQSFWSLVTTAAVILVFVLFQLLCHPSRKFARARQRTHCATRRLLACIQMSAPSPSFLGTTLRASISSPTPLMRPTSGWQAWCVWWMPTPSSVSGERGGFTPHPKHCFTAPFLQPLL